MQEILHKLKRAKVGSCNCMTKTPEVEFHSDHCRYKNISLAIEGLTVKEEGPWSVSKDGLRIQSDDFTHDVILRVTGDFASDSQRKVYSDQLARRLNRKDVEDGS